MKHAEPLPQDPAELLQQALEGLQASLGTAIVPGELRTWCEALAAEIERARPRVASYANTQRSLLEQIEKEDVELLRRVEHLRGCLDDLRAGFDALRVRTRRLIEADEDQRGSAEATAAAERLREKGLEWIVRARSYHAEVDTWFQESLYRDRGVL